ncbi:MAG: hypothetical protein IIA45_11690 [Bacteroidetes bacterium]|nr:hypothetical protein [Bacteroidota bacterium]
MSFNGSEGESISKQNAADMTRTYREENPGTRKAHFFGKVIIENILGQEGCMGIRIYYGIDSQQNLQLLVVGANANEDDQLGTAETIADLSVPCPNNCGVANDLNGN